MSQHCEAGQKRWNQQRVRETCAIQQRLTSYLFYTLQGVCIIAAVSICLTLSFLSPQCPQIHYLHLRLYFCPTNKFINTVFLDSMHAC